MAPSFAYLSKPSANAEISFAASAPDPEETQMRFGETCRKALAMSSAASRLTCSEPESGIFMNLFLPLREMLVGSFRVVRRGDFFKRAGMFGLLALAVMLSACSYSGWLGPAPARSIYMVGLERYRGIDGSTVYVLGYAIDGAYYAPAFRSEIAVSSFQEYLGTIGTVQFPDGHGLSEIK